MKKVLLVSILALFVLTACGPGKYDAFAQCITDSGAKEFGAYWCPNCADQKAFFGSSFEYVDYIECSLPRRAGQTQICQIEGIESYPTWQFADGSRVTGKLTLQELSGKTGCDLPT